MDRMNTIDAVKLIEEFGHLYYSPNEDDKRKLKLIYAQLLDALTAPYQISVYSMESAPRDTTIALFTKQGLIYSGRYRYGILGEPQQGICSWRDDCSGRFVEPVGWIPLSNIVKI